MVGMEVDLVAAFVNYDLMMKPAEQHDLVLIGFTTL